MLIINLLFACNFNPSKTAPNNNPNDSDSCAVQSLFSGADSTIYGVAAQSGMSTFCLITDQGDTLLLTRTSEDGTEGKIYGDLILGQRFGVITGDEGESLVCAINITELTKHIEHVRVQNAKVYLLSENMEQSAPVEIIVLNQDSCVIMGATGRQVFK